MTAELRLSRRMRRLVSMRRAFFSGRNEGFHRPPHPGHAARLPRGRRRIAGCRLFCIGVDPGAFRGGRDLVLLGRIAGGVLWVSAALAALLSLDRLFQADFEDGTLDVLAISPLSLEAASAAKILAHWITTGLPLVLLSPVLGLLLNLPPRAYGALIASLAIGTPALSGVGGSERH